MIEKSNPSRNARKLTMFGLVCAILLTACSEQDPQQFVEEGKALFGKGEMESARVQFKNALQLNPKLAEAYYGLALLDEKSSAWPAMKRNLQEVLALDPNHVDAHVKMGLLELYEIDKAKQQAAIALKLDPENVGANLLDARINFAEENRPQALNLIERVLGKDAGNADALWLKASILIADKRYDEALGTVNKGLDANPDNLALGRLKIKVHMVQQNADAVVHDYQDLLLKHPDRENLRTELVLILKQIGRDDQAEQTLRDAIERNRSDVRLQLSLVDLVELSDPSRVESVLKELIGSNPNEIGLKGRYAGYLMGHKRYAEAKTVLQEIVATDPSGKDGLTAKVRLAEIALGHNDRALAESLAEEILSVDANNSGALLFRAGLRLNKKDVDGVISDLRIVLRDQPNSDQAMVMMGQAYAMKGEREVAESHWRKALEVNPANLAAIVPLTTELLKREDPARAEELLTKSLKAKPNSPAVLELLVKVRAAKKDWVGAEAAVAELRKLPQQAVAGQMLRGMLATSQGHHLEAIQIYQEVVTQKPDAAEPLLAMGRSYEAAGRRTEFIGFLKSLTKEHPNSLNAYHALAMAYGAENQWPEANKILEEALKREPKSSATYKLLAIALVKQDRGIEVPDLYQKGLAVVPDNPELMLELAKYYEQTKHFEQAIAAYNRLLEKFPNSDEVANNLAYLLVEFVAEHDSLQQAIKLVERFKDASNPYFLDTRAWVLLKNGNADEAVETLKKAVVIAPDNADFHYHLGEAYYALGDRDLSKVELVKFIGLNEKKKFASANTERARALLEQIQTPAAS
ncbi:MAG: tetratricopeptide repeat protein [Gammaproteobacteria bacterium]